MDRPLYSFGMTQAGPNLIVDACAPFSVGCKIFKLISASAEADSAPIATKRPPIKLAREPEFSVRSVTTKMTATKKPAKLALKVAKRRTTKTPD